VSAESSDVWNFIARLFILIEKNELICICGGAIVNSRQEKLRQPLQQAMHSISQRVVMRHNSQMPSMG